MRRLYQTAPTRPRSIRQRRYALVAFAASVLLVFIVWQQRRINVLSAPPPCGQYEDVLAAALDDVQAWSSHLALERITHTLTRTDTPICPSDRSSFTGLWQQIAIDEYFSMVAAHRYDAAQQAHRMQAWHELVRLAGEVGIDRTELLPPRDRFLRAWQNRYWLVADDAFREMHRDGDEAFVSPDDRTRFLVEWGRVLADSSLMADWDRAQTALRTAIAIADKYHLDGSAACRFLTQQYLRGDGDCRQLSIDSSEPFLEADHASSQER